VELIPGELTKEERDYYKEMKEEYTSEAFFMERSEKRLGPLPSDVVREMVQFKVPEGPFVRIITFVKDNRIWELLISGAIHASPLRPTSPIHEIERALKGQPIDEKLFESKITEILNRPTLTLQSLGLSVSNRIYECAIALDFLYEWK
jgi:hypothetical protein